MPRANALSVWGMTRQHHIDIQSIDSLVRRRAGCIYRGALAKIAAQLTAAEWPPLLLFFEPSGLSSVAVPPPLVQALDGDQIGDLLIPWLIDALGAQAMGLAERVACIEVGVWDDSFDQQQHPLAMSEAIVLHLLDGSGQECWVAELGDLRRGQASWQQIDPQVGIYGGLLEGLNAQPIRDYDR